MEEWVRKLLELLTNMSAPITVADIMRIVEVPENDIKVPYDAIARIALTLPKAGYKLVVEDSPCLGYGAWNIFVGGDYSTCKSCGENLVPAPKFCINRDEWSPFD